MLVAVVGAILEEHAACGRRARRLRERLLENFPSDFIIRKDDVAKEMFFIQRGVCHVLADDELTPLFTLPTGSFFGEIALVLSSSSRHSAHGFRQEFWQRKRSVRGNTRKQ